MQGSFIYCLHVKGKITSVRHGYADKFLKPEYSPFQHVILIHSSITEAVGIQKLTKSIHKRIWSLHHMSGRCLPSFCELSQSPAKPLPVHRHPSLVCPIPKIQEPLEIQELIIQLSHLGITMYYSRLDLFSLRIPPQRIDGISSGHRRIQFASVSQPDIYCRP